jgi:hypothetical protein
MVVQRIARAWLTVGSKPATLLREDALGNDNAQCGAVLGTAVVIS